MPVKERFDENRWNGRPVSHDRFVFTLANAYGDVAYVPDGLALYRRHQGAVTGSTRGDPTWRQTTLKNRADMIFSADSASFRHLATYCAGIARFFEGVRDESFDRAGDGDFAHRTEAAAEYYGQLSLVFSSRAELHDAHLPRSVRFRAFWPVFHDGAYWSIKQGRGLGMRALLRDVSRLAL
jgi:hypothetical protein